MAQALKPATGRGKARLAMPLLGLLALHIAGVDQGNFPGLVQGGVAFEQHLIHDVVHDAGQSPGLVHDFLHDARHAVGLPCH
jgi:hypothetical protein